MQTLGYISDIMNKLHYYIIIILFSGSLSVYGQSRKLSHAEVLADIDTLVSALTTIHPDLFFECSEKQFHEALNRVKKDIPDSLSVIEFYRYIQPLTTMFGDGHTQLYFPEKIIHENNHLLLPLTVDINQNDSTITVTQDYTYNDIFIPKGTHILSINGENYRTLIDRMLIYCSGERPFFRLSKVNRDFVHFLYMLYPAKEYRLGCHLRGKEYDITVPALPYQQCSYGTGLTNRKKRPDYSLQLMESQSTAIMEFNAFTDLKQFKQFTDSIFNILKQKQIQHLIIDLRSNGGGDSNLGDELLQYISPVPFKQFGKQIIRYSDLQKQLALALFSKDFRDIPNGIKVEKETDELIPLRNNPLRYQGKVYLLISHTTFSSATSLSWAFKNFNMGTTIGEETGGLSVCFGDIVIFKLPYSQLNSTISFARMYMYKATEKDIHGTLPDILIPANEALEYTLKHLIVE